MPEILGSRCCRTILAVLVVLLGLGSLQGQTDPLRINEFLALNKSGLTDEDGDHSDWIEIYNSGDVDLSLAGWCLSDDREAPGKWVFPDVIIPSHGYALVFASDKDRHSAGNELHTNFKLAGAGEFLALYNPQGIAVSAFDPGFPPQNTDISYGFLNGEYWTFSPPTPGSENLGSGAILPAPEMGRPHGLFETAFDLEISSGVDGALVYYSTGGNIPDPVSGMRYTSPIRVSSTTIIRAMAIMEGRQPSSVVTRSYIFPDDVIHQSDHPPGYPEQWGPYTAIEGTAVADYEMDPDLMADPGFASDAAAGLRSIPTMSLVSDIDALFSHSADPDTGGIYIYTGPPLSRTEDGLGKGWERPGSIEYFHAEGQVSLQENCGIRIQGGHSRRPEKSPKHSFRLVFRESYGASRLRYPLFGDDATSNFNSIVLRAGFGNSWIHHSHQERSRAQYLRDIWSKDTQRAMGHPSSSSEYVHLYINGIYWGIYAPSERIDSDFAAAYMEGDPGDFDVIKDYQDVIDGEINAWNRLMEMANNGLESNEAYRQIQGCRPDGTPDPSIAAMVDVENLADYMLINFYGGNTDWDHHNWAAVRNRVNPGKGFKFLCWDSEHILKSLSQNVLEENNNECPSRIFQQLRQNPEFRRLFADRVRKYCFDGGLLTPVSAAARWTDRMDQVEPVIDLESARWGDYRRDVHQFQATGPFDLYTYQDHWLAQKDFMLNTYFPGRTEIFLDQLRSAGLYPELDAPEFMINGDPLNGAPVSRGDILTMSSEEGVIYYTTSGADPALSPEAVMYSEPLVLENSSQILARTFLNDEWSAMSEVLIAFPGDLYDLRITEIHYHPLDEDTIDGDKFEFVELKNSGPATLHLGGVHFADGITYTFPAGSLLLPGGYAVVASDRLHFYNRYGFLPGGTYSGNLSNGGEWLVLANPEGDTLCALRYGDDPPWPILADGAGYSLVPVVPDPPADQNDPEQWRVSYAIGGSPGREDRETTAVDRPEELPGYLLSQNYPNPFSDLTHIRVNLPAEAVMELSIFNLVGQKIATLVAGSQPAGSSLLTWNGKDDAGNRVKSGIYFYRMIIRDQQECVMITRKMMLF